VEFGSFQQQSATLLELQPHFQMHTLSASTNPHEIPISQETHQNPRPDDEEACFGMVCLVRLELEYVLTFDR